MKNISLAFLMTILIIPLFFSSCKKQEIEPNYTWVDEEYNPKDSVNNYITNDLDGYTNGGTIPTYTEDDNIMLGTKWVLIKYVSSFATEYPNDTIEFVTEQYYTLNGGANRKYTLAKSPTNSTYDLTLYYFFPFGGGHYSAEVSEYVVDDAEINNTEFEDIRQGENTKIKAWLIKIN